MKMISLALTAASGLAMAAPLAAQTWAGDRSQSRDWNRGGSVVADLRRQIDAGIGSGAITRREATTLRIDLNALARLERNYNRDGISRGESATLIRRAAGLQRMILRAQNNGNRGAPGW